MRFVLALVVALGCVLLVRANALAVSEYCPAQVEDTHQFLGTDPGLYSFDLLAQSDRSVTGDVIVQTNVGWFSVPFADTHIEADTATYKNDYVQFDRTTYRSAPLYVRFPTNVANVLRWWVTDAQTHGESAYGWDAKGKVSCQPLASDGLHIISRKSVDDPKRETPPSVDLTQMPGPKNTVITPSLTSAPGDVSCAHPFENSRVTNPGSLRMPIGMNVKREVSVLVEIAISAEGTLDGAWVYQPSGVDWLDDEALQAAKQSTYAAGTALCKPAPGLYVFRAEFKPRS